MATGVKAPRNGQRETYEGSQALRVASAGIRTMRHLGNFSLAIGVDVLRGQIGSREATSVLGAVRETRRNIQVGQSIGENKQVLDHAASGEVVN